MENGYNPIINYPSDNDLRQAYQRGFKQGMETALRGVVRCEECKYRVKPSKMCSHPKAVGWDALETDDYDFCSCGEREETKNAN